jgi:hypothetical protein
MAYVFAELASLTPPPPVGQPIQLVGRLCDVDEQRPRAWLEAPAAAGAARGGGGGAVARRLAVDTSLLPAGDVHRAARAGLVHALGVLRVEVGGEEGEEGAGEGAAPAPRLTFQVEMLRLAEGADCAALARALRDREQLLRECE